MKKKLLLGLAAMVLPLAMWAQEDGSPALVIDGLENGVTFTYGEKPSFTVKWNDGEGNVTELDSKYYTVTYASDDAENPTLVKNVGTYTVTVEGTSGVYKLVDPKTVSFTIDKKEVTGLTFTTTAVSREYDGTDNDASVLPQLVLGATGLVGTEADKDEELANFLKCLKVVRQSGEEGTDANGNYHVSVQGYPKDDATGSNYYFPEQDAGNWVRMHITPIELTASLEFDRQYNGQKLTPANLNSRVAFDKVLEADKDFVKASLSYKGSENLTDAAPYTLDLTLTGNKAKNYTLATETIGIEITQVPLTITLNETDKDKLTKAYNGEKGDVEVTDYFTITANPSVSSNNIFDTEKESLALAVLAEISSKGETAGAAGTYTVGLYQKETKEGKETFKEAELKNYSYEFASEDYAYVITGKKLEKEAVTYSSDEKLLVYQGKAFEITDGFVTVKDGETVLEENTDYELSLTTTYPTTEGAEATNAADRFTVTVTGKGNYAGTVITSDEFTITKATLTIEPKKNEAGEYVHASKTYGDKDPEDFMSLYEITGWKGDIDNAETIGLTMDRAKENLPGVTNYEAAGVYPVRLYKNDIQIKKSTGEYESAFTNYKVEYDVDATEIDTKFHITKKPVTYHIAAATAEYGDKTPEFTVEVDGLVDADEDKDIFVSGKAPIVALAKDSEGKDVTATNVGDYLLTITNENEVEATNYDLTYDGTQEGHKDGKYTITAAPLTITVADQTITFAEKENLDELLVEWAKYQSTGKQIVSFTGNKYNDGGSLRQFFTLGKSVALENGEGEINDDGDDVYENGIVVNVKDEDDLATEALKTIYKNYTIEGVPGTLTIAGENTPLVLDGSIEDDALVEKLKAMNGAVVKSVKITNLQNVRSPRVLTAKQWYTLVLPFDVRVRDLSSAFGYAIVNVPNTGNTNPDVISFQLTMDEIPANTLMVFKVDEDMPWAENDEVVFTNKKIVYDPEAEPISDVAGNVFCGVYEKTGISETNDWYIWTDGKPYSAGAAARTIYPLNGYVHFKEATANARIILEEADGSTTAINAVGADKSNAAEGWYSVDGVKLNNQPTQKGVYINNGKKVVIK